MKKWMIWCLAIMIALPSAAATPVYADDNTANTTNSNTTSNNSTVSSDTYSTNNSSTSTDNTNTSTSGGGGTVITIATTNKPVINLIGDSNVRMKVGTTFADSGTTVQDDVYNDLTAKVTYTLNSQPVDSINTNVTGNYVIHYNVTTSDNRVANEATRTVTIVNVGDYTNLSSINVPNAYGMAYYGDYVYVAQRDKGLARVNLYSGKIEQIVSSNQSFMAVALDSSGNLFYTIDSDSTIYKLDHNDLNNLPLSQSDFTTKKSAYFSSNQYTFFYGLAVDSKDNIYFTDYSSKSIIKLPTNSLTPQVVINSFSVKFTSFTFDPLGNLYTSGRDGNVYRIDSSSLQSLPLSANSLVNISNGQFSGGYGMFFTPDGTSYMGSSFEKNPESTLIPVITLNGSSPTIVNQNDNFYDPGVTVTPSQYTNLQTVTTYTLNGSPVPGVDTSVPGTYTIHYNASISPQYVAKEVTRDVIVKSGPSQLSDVSVKRPFGLAYYNGDVYYADYSRGIYKISTKTFKVTRISKSDDYDMVAVAVNKNGDLFYSFSGQRKIYKLDHSYLNDSEFLPYSESNLMKSSTVYYEAPRDTTDNGYDVSINGLAFDGNDSLYFTLQMDNELRAFSQILRFSANSATNPELVATYPTRAYGLTISPLGNLYVNVGLNGLYKADASLLNNVPIAATQFKLMDNFNSAYGVVFLPDRTGYTSSVEPTGTLRKLGFLDSVPTIPVTSIQLNPSTLTFTEGDAPALLTASILPDNATDIQLVWKSSNEQVATVQNGIVTPVGTGTASISVYAASQPEASAMATITVNAKPVIVKDDKKKTDSKLTLGVDGGAGKMFVPSTATESRSTQFDGSTVRTITFDPDKMPAAINLLKNMKESTIRLNIPTIDNLSLNTDINLPLSVSNSISSNDMNLDINTNKIQLSIPSSSMLKVNQDVTFKINVLDQYKDMINEKIRASNMSLVKQIVGNGDLSVVSQPIDIITNFQNKPVDVLIPLDTVKIPSLSVVKSLYVYVNHSDGSEEFIKPIQITDDSGNTVLKINTSKFSTFTVMQVSSTSTPTTTGTTPVTGTNPANTGGIVKPAYIEGYPDGTFRPNNSLTRAELASLLYRLQATSSNAGAVKSFKDVSSSFWANQAIQSMQSAGLMSGLPNGTFAPSKPITRAEMAIILSRWQSLSGQSGTTFATDINGHWAERDIKLVLTAGLMQGISPSSFQPNAPLTRAQAVTILNKILEKTAVLSARPTPWKDVPSSHWAYADIMEASNSYSLK
ncbi:S-layer homology domain-containing protein [Paenibacillus campi]|uniref:S-layer homology domain-containing protein n=1 Tax=Paenibacillus campi TaxID=3106031 RepID=UPI002AFFBA39|nr:S-layer homology domain-containing protein [Paenibacillus sp. SGZ-1014]